MAHPRRVIRDAIVARLTASPAVLALVPPPPVEGCRNVPLDDASLPRVLVYFRGDTAPDRLLEAPRVYRIVSDLVVEFVARLKVTAGIPEDELDLVAEALELTLDDLETSKVGGLCRQMRYKSTAVAVDVQGERATVSLLLAYEIEYTRQVAPMLETDFASNSIEYLTGDDSPADNPTDSVALPIV